MGSEEHWRGGGGKGISSLGGGEAKKYDMGEADEREVLRLRRGRSGLLLLSSLPGSAPV